MNNPIAAVGALRPAPQQDGSLLDLRKIFSVVRRHLLWALAALAIALGLSLAAYALATPKFTATARVALDRTVDDLVTNQATTPSTDSPSVDTEVQVLLSPKVVGRVVDNLGLARLKGFGQPLEGAALGPAESRARALDSVRANLTAKREGVSYAIRITYSSQNPVEAARIVNGVVDSYVEGQKGDKVSERSRDTSLLADRLQTLRNDVQVAEQAVAQYRGANNILDVQKDSTAVQQEISILNTQLATAKAEQAAADARLAASRGSSGLESDVTRNLRGQQANLSAQRADLAGRYGELHPNLAKVDRQLADITASINAEMGRVRGGYDSEARIAQGRTSSIQASLNRARGQLEMANGASVQLNELQRNADSAKVLYQSLLDRYNQSVTGQGTERSSAYVIARATTPPSPDSPDLALYLLGGLVAGLLSGAAVMLLLEFMENGFQTRSELETKLGLAVMASVPDLTTIPNVSISRRDPMAPANYLSGHEGSIFNESFRSIRGGLPIGRSESRFRTLTVTSALPDEGKTTISICLARSAAMAGLKTLIIDCDLRRRASSRAMCDDVTIGLVEVLKDRSLFTKAVTRDASGAWILPQRDTAAHDYDIVASQAMVELLASIRDSFDLIILDTAPILALAEARAVAAMSDGVMFVVRWRKTPVQATQLALDQLGRAGANVVGAVLSKVNLQQQARAGSADEMIYYKKFKSYYTS